MNKPVLIISIIVIVVIAIIIGIIIDQMTSPPPPYRIIAGNLEVLPAQELSKLDNLGHNKELVVWRSQNAKIKLANQIEIQFIGDLAVDLKESVVYLFQGQAEIKTPAQMNIWKLITRAVILEMLANTHFEAQLQPIQAPNGQKNESGDDGQQIQLKVNQGQVIALAQGKPRPQPVPAGQNIDIILKAVCRQGKIRAIGLGELGPQPPAIAKRGQKMAADMDLRRNLQEFSSGIKFIIPSENNGLSVSSAQFSSEGQQNFSVQPTYQSLTPKTLLCQAEVDIERVNPVARRYCNVYKGIGTAAPEQHPNLSMAILGARRNATIMAIQQAAWDYYGNPIPSDKKELRGTFFPESYTVQQNNEGWIAEISGEVLFE